MTMYIFVLLVSNSWDTEANPGPESLIDDSHFPCDYVMSVLGGKIEGFVATHVSGFGWG